MEARTGASHLGLKLGNTYLNAIDGDVIFQNNSAIRFGGDSWDYNVWAGLKYVHSNKKIVLGLADGAEFTANAAQSGGTFKIVGVSKISYLAKKYTWTLPAGRHCPSGRSPADWRRPSSMPALQATICLNFWRKTWRISSGARSLPASTSRRTIARLNMMWS